MSYSFDKNRKQWMVRATVDGKRQYIGRFNTEEEAICANSLTMDSLYSYKTPYIEIDTSFNWIKAFKKMREARRRKRIDNAKKRKEKSKK